MSLRPSLFLLLCLPMACTVASAQSVWRCGPEGRSYSDSPCPEGRVVAAADPRSAGDVAAARAVLARDQRLAQQLVAERREREREALARGSGLAAIGAGEGVRPAAKPKAAKERTPLPRAKPRPAAGEQTSPAADPGARRMPG